ncbi:MAG: hypothetical protein GY915_06740 [bacterium]|nr:hypothetical protein [bacterium]
MGDLKSLQRQECQGEVEILGQCSLECFARVRDVFKRLKKEGIEFDSNILQRIPPKEVALSLLELMDQDFPLESLQVAYKAVWGFDGQEEVDEGLNWEDAFCSSDTALEMSPYIQSRLDPGLDYRTISYEGFSEIPKTPQEEMLEFLVGLDKTTPMPQEDSQEKLLPRLSQELWEGH